MNFDDVLKVASLPIDTLPLCLAGDLVEELSTLERTLADTPAPANLGDGRRAALVEQIADVRARMRAATVDFRLRAVPARQWTRLWTAYPTRAEGESDEAWEAREFAAQAEVVALTALDPVMSVAQVAELVDLVHYGTWAQLAARCFSLNRREVDIPNSEAVSASSPSSDQT